MYKFIRKLDVPGQPRAALSLTLEDRVRSRLRTTLDDGREAGLFLGRGTTLKDGDQVSTDDGFIAEVRAALETVSTVDCADALTLARVAYHLGNRHVALEITASRLRYLHDHVLDDLVRGLGLDVRVEQAPFEPEAGAYGGHSHAHGHHHHEH